MQQGTSRLFAIGPRTDAPFALPGLLCRESEPIGARVVQEQIPTVPKIDAEVCCETIVEQVRQRRCLCRNRGGQQDRRHERFECVPHRSPPLQSSSASAASESQTSEAQSKQCDRPWFGDCSLAH